MQNMSPLLQNNINNKLDAHDKMYQDMKNVKPEIKPDAPKAYMVKENPIQSVGSYFKDNAKDVANFSHVIKTGEISDNNLGRLNDLGLKLGSILIASFLAIHSKTKQETAMRFVGGAAFLASMKLWPKLFINIPSKLIHGVDPGEKYVNAQGDKKEFWLDNQFLLWDVKGITDEQEQRRQQAVALQNRTLNMATAGFGVPLMTAFMCNALEKPVSKAINYFDVRRVQNNIKDVDSLDTYLNSARPIVRNQQRLENIMKLYQDKPFDGKFYDEVADIFRIDDFARKDPDFIKVIGEFSPLTLPNNLAEKWEEDSLFTGKRSDIESAFEQLQIRTENGVNPHFMSPKEQKEFIDPIYRKLDLMKKESVISYITPKLSGEQVKELYKQYPDLVKENQENLTKSFISELKKAQAQLNNSQFNDKQVQEQVENQIKGSLAEITNLATEKDVKDIFKSVAGDVDRMRLDDLMLQFKDSDSVVKETIAQMALKGEVSIPRIVDVLKDVVDSDNKCVFDEITLEKIKGYAQNPDDLLSFAKLKTEFNKLMNSVSEDKLKDANKGLKEINKAILDGIGESQVKVYQDATRKLIDSTSAEDCKKILSSFTHLLSQEQKIKYFDKVISTVADKDPSALYESLFKNASTEQLKSGLSDILKDKTISIDDILNSPIVNLRKNQQQELKEIVDNIKLSYKDIYNAINAYAEKSIGLSDGSEQIKECMKKLAFDKSRFFDTLRRYNEDYVAVGRARVNAYLKLVNPIAGRTAESVYTTAYNDYMKKLFSTLHCATDRKGSKRMSLEAMAKNKSQITSKFVREYFQDCVKDIEFGSEEYEKMVKKLTPIEIPESVKECAQKLGDIKNVERIQQIKDAEQLYKGIFGESSSSIHNIISKFVSNETLNINSVLSRVGVALNYEARRASGLIKTNGINVEEFDKIAQEILYEGNVSKLTILKQKYPDKCSEVIKAIFDTESFKNEPEMVKNYVKLMNDYLLKGEINGKSINPKEEAILCTDIVGLLKSQSSKVFNDKTWLKTFGGMAIILTAFTLLIQPFFGRVQKEFNGKNKEGGNK